MFTDNESLEDMKKEAFEICRSFLLGPWKTLKIENFRFSAIRGGLSNTLYHCALPENCVVKDSRVPKEALLRIYGPLQEDSNVVIREAVTYMLLSERNLGPKLYGVFPKGRLEEFIPSRNINRDDIRNMATTIAREMAKIHALDVPVVKTPEIWQYVNKWLDDIEEEFLKRNQSFSQRQWYEEEFEWLTKEMEKTNSPLVYCHNDLHGGNILLRENSSKLNEPDINLIDFEFGGYNYRGFDIGNHFCEWCFNYITEKFPFFEGDFNKFPSEEEQVTYFKVYLDQLQKEGRLTNVSLEDEIKSLLREIPVFSMAANYIWSIWSIKMSFLGLEFPHKEHNKVRIKAYHAIKEKYLKSSLANSEMNECNN
ncbi:choline/ethanolamine kinase-like [Stegodyphus dumicola]|uniref:choline/ethanolamine kinase-like n=1 Tax=Stegodyphus dumicola TaxID=202533 RepID=UPI0015ABF646|nr:choline/ethanolamine kinase-like [Stegodyphus dumicola]